MQLFRDYGRIRMWRRPHEAMDPSYQQGNVQAGVRLIMVCRMLTLHVWGWVRWFIPTYHCFCNYLHPLIDCVWLVFFFRYLVSLQNKSTESKWKKKLCKFCFYTSLITNVFTIVFFIEQYFRTSVTLAIWIVLYWSIFWTAAKS